MGQNCATLTRDAENRDPQKARRADEQGEKSLLLPSDVSRAICSSDTAGTAGFSEGQGRSKITALQRKTLVTSALLPRIEFPNLSRIDARGTEHVVTFRGERVEKHQRAEAWVPVLTAMPLGKADGFKCIFAFIRFISRQSRPTGYRLADLAGTVPLSSRSRCLPDY
jgi:hypothetical protein